MSVKLVSTKQAAKALGASESSLKRWCDQGLMEVVKTVGGHRKIPVGEIVQFARQWGLQLSPAEVSIDVGENHAVAAGERALFFAETLLSGDSAAARNFVFQLFQNKIAVSELCDDVIAGAFRLIGDRWSCRQADVYQERRGCEIVNKIIHEMHTHLRSPLMERTAIGGTLSGDHYSVPGAMVDLVLRSERYRTENLGCSLPASSFVRAIRDLCPQLLWISVSQIEDENQFIVDLNEIWSACVESDVALIIGGRVLTESVRRKLTFTAYCESMKSLAALAASLARIAARNRKTRRGRTKVSTCR